MAAPAFSIQSQNGTRLADPALRESLLKYARKRLPPAEVEDLVQNTLTEALLGANAPREEAEFRRWVHGIARHKIADTYRRRGRLPIASSDLDVGAAAPSAPLGELSQWLESELPKTDGAQATLHWLLREGDGESLDEIARDVELPAPRVRQRVSRLRRHLHARWLALGAAGLLLFVGAGTLLYQTSKGSNVPPSIAREPVPPLERARSLRQNALQQCAAFAYRECIAALDQAKALDPSGESASAVREARAAAMNSEQPPVLPSVPRGAPSVSSPDQQSTPDSTPKQSTPSKQVPKQFAPSKALHKPEPLGATQKQNALPGKSGLAKFDEGIADPPAAKAPKSKKR